MTPFIFAVIGYAVAVIFESWLSVATWRIVKNKAAHHYLDYNAYHIRKMWNVWWLIMQINQVAVCLVAMIVYLALPDEPASFAGAMVHGLMR